MNEMDHTLEADPVDWQIEIVMSEEIRYVFREIKIDKASLFGNGLLKEGDSNNRRRLKLEFGIISEKLR